MRAPSQRPSSFQLQYDHKRQHFKVTANGAVAVFTALLFVATIIGVIGIAKHWW